MGLRLEHSCFQHLGAKVVYRSCSRCIQTSTPDPLRREQEEAEVHFRERGGNFTHRFGHEHGFSVEPSPFHEQPVDVDPVSRPARHRLCPKRHDLVSCTYIRTVHGSAAGESCRGSGVGGRAALAMKLDPFDDCQSVLPLVGGRKT